MRTGDRHPVNKSFFMQRETRGERSTTWSTGGWASKKPCYNYDKTPYSGQGGSMSQWHGRKDTKAQLGQTPRHDRPSRRDVSLRGRQLSHSGTNKKDRPKGARPKGPWDLAKERTLNGPPTGLRSHLRECSTVVTTSSRRNAQGIVDDPTTVRSSRMVGYATPRPQNTTQSNAPTVDSWWTR